MTTLGRFACKARESGFTLLELLVALALMSLLSLALFGSVRYGTRIWEASRDTSQSAEAVREAQEAIAQLVSAAYPQFVVADARHASIAFSGQATELNFLAPDPTIGGALDRVNIRRVQTGDKGSLVVQRALELGVRGRNLPQTEVLLGDIAKLRFGYFGPAKAGTKPTWQQTWLGRTRPPFLVRIDAVSSDQRTTWPALTVAPQIVADVSCNLDTISKFCQGR